MARQAVRDAGYEIALDLFPKSIGKITYFVFFKIDSYNFIQFEYFSLKKIEKKLKTHFFNKKIRRFDSVCNISVQDKRALEYMGF